MEKQFYAKEEIPTPREMKPRMLPVDRTLRNSQSHDGKCPLCPKITCKPSRLREAHKLIISEYNFILHELEQRTYDLKVFRLSHRMEWNM